MALTNVVRAQVSYGKITIMHRKPKTSSLFVSKCYTNSLHTFTFTVLPIHKEGNPQMIYVAFIVRVTTVLWLFSVLSVACLRSIKNILHLADLHALLENALSINAFL